MTIEQAKALVPDKDFVVFNQKICKARDLLVAGEKYWLRVEIEESTIQLVEIKNVHTLGSFRGCFDSSVLPPKISNYGNMGFSVDVIIEAFDTIFTGFYSYQKEEWRIYVFNDNNGSCKLHEDNFKWCFKPDYLKF